MTVLGEHWLLEYCGCSIEKLTHSDQVKTILIAAIQKANGTVVTDVFHNFSPHGVSGVVVIAESHVTIHTWPEHRYAAVDIFSCSSRLDKKAIRAYLKAEFQASRVTGRNFKRGPVLPGSPLPFVPTTPASDLEMPATTRRI